MLGLGLARRRAKRQEQAVASVVRGAARFVVPGPPPLGRHGRRAARYVAEAEEERAEGGHGADG
eukprot:scaffold42066_cov67-Phaeocystis_antarctica.AAC.3